MPSTDKTNHGLNAWLPGDRPDFDDHNSDNAIVESGVMWGEDYDPDGNVEEAGGIPIYVRNAILWPGAGPHNSLCRGKDLGTSVTADQYTAISNDTFDDLYIGDYWTIGGVVYRIAAFNYLYNCGNTELTVPHVTIVPDKALYNAQMNATNITTGGYTGSAMYAANLAQAKTIIKAAFPNHVLSHRENLTNAVTNGKPSGGAWFDSEVELMNERMVYGNAVFSSVSDGTTVPFQYTVSKSQLPLFAHRPDAINFRESYWLQDVITASAFANVNAYGRAAYGDASGSLGVRPAFSIF